MSTEILRWLDDLSSSEALRVTGDAQRHRPRNGKLVQVTNDHRKVGSHPAPAMMKQKGRALHPNKSLLFLLQTLH